MEVASARHCCRKKVGNLPKGTSTNLGPEWFGAWMAEGLGGLGTPGSRRSLGFVLCHGDDEEHIPYSFLHIWERVLMHESGRGLGGEAGRRALVRWGLGRRQLLPAVRESPGRERTPFDICSAIWT